jgi:hypothetical protein
VDPEGVECAVEGVAEDAGAAVGEADAEGEADGELDGEAVALGAEPVARLSVPQGTARASTTMSAPAGNCGVAASRKWIRRCQVAGNTK